MSWAWLYLGSRDSSIYCTTLYKTVSVETMQLSTTKLTNVFTTCWCSRDSVRPSFDAISEREFIVVLANNFSALLFNSLDSTLTCSRRHNIQGHLQELCTLRMMRKRICVCSHNSRLPESWLRHAPNEYNHSTVALSQWWVRLENTLDGLGLSNVVSDRGSQVHTFSRWRW